VSGSLLHTLLSAVHWSDETKEAITTASDSIRKAFGAEDGVKEIQTAIEKCWVDLHAAPEHRQVTIRPVARRVEEIIRQVEATFSPGPADKEDGIERLSDGQRSLFYLAIVAALFDVQEAVGASDSEAISRDKLMPPVLNLLAVEEPENHVAPHYLGRIMTLLRRVSKSDRGQVVISSHSASILSRVAVLKEGSVGDTYSDDQRLGFFWYRYLFLGRSKPATHILALSEIEDDEFASKAPAVLRRLMNKIKSVLLDALAEPSDED
jgi:hypothetical protein